MPKPRVLVLALGGTIASVPESGRSAAVPRLGPEELLAAVPGIGESARIEAESLRTSPSGDLTVRDVTELAEVIRTRPADGFVITQGTDTLEETSYLLDLLLGAGGPPVVLTGAMRNPSLPGADGPANLLAAVRVAAAPQAEGLGPLVVFADEIHLARYARKSHSSSVTAFDSPNAGPVGRVHEGKVRIPLAPRHHPPPLQVPGERVPSVGIVKFGLGSGPLLPQHAAGHDGMVLEVFGGGHVPSFAVDSLAELNERIPVVFAGRTGGGELYEATYGFPGSEQDLLGRGLISGVAFDGVKARLLLTVLLAADADRPAIKARFAAEP
ncbi:MAG: asparaginase [Saccharopolyspora sp.]|uniref:asparaginase n=1 Tax=Saccharopolyspora sp. TaxID=33915 RepID=UPI0025D97482|nr:asparaginase [Saccharopolyspora sp.]MBQ6642019.1 asparaginase [Saccharopolyspora sp.]